LVSGVFLLLRQGGSLSLGRVLLAGCALLMGVIAAVTPGWLRGRRIRAARAGTEHPILPEPSVEVLIAGLAVAAFAGGTVAVLLR
jgi:hypothetical protein